MKTIYYATIIILLYLFALLPYFAQGQTHDDNALFKNTIRQECHSRFGTDPGCGRALEDWMKLIDELLACQINYAMMIARSDQALANLYSLMPGTQLFGFGNLGVTGYVVPQMIAFQDYELGKYSSLSQSISEHIKAGRATMRDYIGQIGFLYEVETYHRSLAGLPPAKKLSRPIFN